jgi:hypothetical protein
MGKNWNWSQESKAKFSETCKNRRLSKETKAKIGSSVKGEHNPFYGKHHTEETKERIRLDHIGKFKGESNPNFSNYWTEEQKLRMSINHKSKEISVDTSNPFYGHHHTEEFKKRKRLEILGTKLSEETKSKISQSLKGTHTEPKSEEHKRKISESRKGKYAGKNHPRWRGGASNESYPYEFNHDLKEEIRKRDEYQCQLCYVSQNGNRLDIHHIDYNKDNLDKFNLISLCHSCHCKTGANREYYTEYFNILLHKQNIF